MVLAPETTISENIKDQQQKCQNALHAKKRGYTAWHPDCKVQQKKKERAQVRLASIANRYPVRPRFEQGRLASAAPILLDEDGFQMVTCKRKALENLTDTSVNLVAGKTRTEKPGRPSISARLAEKETRQQII